MPFRRFVCFTLLAAWISSTRRAPGQSGSIELTAIVDAGSYSPARPIAPGSIATLFGTGLASEVRVANGIPLPRVLGSTRVMVNGAAAPLLYASPTQVNFQFPFEATGSSAAVVVRVGSVESAPLVVSSAPVSPAVFTLLANGAGPGAILHTDGTPLSRSNPLRPDETVSLYATGLGAVSPAVESGAAAPGPPLLSTVIAPVRVLFDGQPGRIEFAGLAPSWVGLYQVNVRAPPALSAPYPAIRLEASGAGSNPVTAGGPGLLDVNPSTTAAGVETAIVVRGKNLSATSLLEISGRLIPGQWVSGDLEEFRASIPAGLLSAPGRVVFTLTENLGGTLVRSNSQELVVTPPPAPAVSKQELAFTLSACSSQLASDTLAVSNAGTGRLDWQATTTGETWLRVSPQRGTAPSAVTVNVDSTRLPAGRYASTIIIATASGLLREARIQVSLVVGPMTPAPSPVLSPVVYITDNLQRIGRDDPLPADGEKSAAVFAARNEYQAFQIVVHGGAAGLIGVNAELIAPLVNPLCSSLPAGRATFYREHYVTVSSPSKLGIGGARAGVYPDALIPFRNPFTGQPLRGGTYPSAPFDVPARQNQPVYVEIYVPPDTPAGIYGGSITVTYADGVKLADVPLRLTVWDLTLPAAPSFRSAFQSSDSEHLEGPVPYYGYAPYGPEHLSMAKAMDEHLIAHRLMPESQVNVGFRVDLSGHIVANPQNDGMIESLLARPEYSDFWLPFHQSTPFLDPLGVNRDRALIYLRDAYQWLSSRGFAKKAWLRQVDEPQTPSAFQRARDFADLIHEANPNYRVAVATTFGRSELATYLYGHVNVFVMGNFLFDPVESARRQAAGDEIWTYTALVQVPENPSPFWLIDFPLLNFRVIPWISYRYGLAGVEYWTTAYWQELRALGRSPWADPCTYHSREVCFNGDGMLVYPGKEVNYVVPQNAYGPASPAAVYGPIPSLRLKALRDGMQDYELLNLVARLDPGAAQQAAIQVGCAGSADPGDANSNCFHSWNRDPNGLLQARLELASRISASKTSAATATTLAGGRDINSSSSRRMSTSHSSPAR